MSHSSASAVAATEILGTALDWLRQGRSAAIGSVIACWGSAPCPVGSMIAVRDDGVFVGSVSGGCVEGEVIVEALEVAQGGSARTLEFGVSDRRAWRSGLTCGGRIRIYVEPFVDDGDAVC